MMRFKSLIAAIAGLLCLGVAPVFGQVANPAPDLYIAKDIPDSLKEDANSVVRYELDETEVSGPGQCVEKVHSIVTILNEKGARHAEMSLGYNRKFSTVGSFEMMVYDADGKLLKKYHKSDMYDHAVEDEMTIVTDERMLSIRHEIVSYPATVEMIFEVDNKSLINLGGWDIQQEEQSVQNSYCKVSVAADAGFRYLNRNTKVTPQKTDINGTDIYTWKVSGLKAFKHEEGSKNWQVLPEIRFTENKFEFYGRPGDIDNWENYGKWQQELNADVCTLSPKRVAELQQQTANLASDKQKAMYLYNYLQHNMRYVSIQLGIGGLKPFSADFVDQKKYGDCKALSNYMVAMLKAVNIPAYYALVRAGANEEPASPDFPFDTFNHIIVCVPLKGDTTWLECTSSTIPFGELGSFTENRNALLITENGGKLINTPKSTAKANQFNSQVHLILNADGSAKAQINIAGTGGYREMFVDEIPAYKPDEQRELILRNFGIKQPTVFEFKPGDDANGTKKVDINLEFDKFSDAISGDRQFYKPSVFNLCGFTVPITEKRHSDYYFEHPMTKSCVTTIDLPEGFTAESVPANVSLKFVYGSYDVVYTYDAAKNQLVSTAKFVMDKQVIPAAKYNELQAYLDNVSRAQNKKLVIKRKV